MSPAAALILEMQIYPIILKTIHRKAKPVGSEDYQELIQDTTATAAAMIDSMEKSGRRSCGNSRTDVMNPGYQMDNEGSVCSMQAPVGGEDEDFTVGDMIASRTEDIAAKVLRQIDWAAFMQTLDSRKRVIVQELMVGGGTGGTGDIARRLAVTSARIVQLKREIGEAIRKFMGEAILVDSVSESVWQRDMRCLRERNEWKHTKLDRTDDPEQANLAEAGAGNSAPASFNDYI